MALRSAPPEPVYLPAADVAERLFRVDMWDTPSAILNAVFSPRSRVAVKACHASSKCVAASEYLTLSTGERVQAGDLIGTSFLLPSRDENGEPFDAWASAEFNTVEPVFAITTESGRRAVRNANHPFWVADGVFPAGNRCKITPRGWTQLQDIGPGMLVAVPERLLIDGQQRLPDDEIKALAYLIGDGGYTARGVSFSQLPGPQLTEFTECVTALGAHLTPHDYVTYRVVGDAGETRTSVSLSPSRTTTHRVNPIVDLLKRHGLMGKHSRDKRIPAAIFELPLDSLRSFLSRLYATDGWASGGGAAPVIGFCSASRGMIQDLQELLLRFGVCGRIRKAGPRVEAWTLTAQASADVIQFADAIGIYGKEVAVDAAWKRAVQMQATTQRRVWRHKNAPAGLRWERVVSVEPAGVEATIAIGVPGPQTFLTTFWEHNTHTAAIVVALTLYEGGDVLTTAPTWEQVKTVLWGEVHRLLQGSVIPLSEWGQINQTEIVMPDGSHALGLSTNEGVRFQGWHARPGSFLQLIADEAPGVRPDIFAAWEGISAGGDVRHLLLGNPVVNSGPFFDIFYEESPGWDRFTIDAFDTPNLRGLSLADLLEPSCRLDLSERPYLVDRQWVRDRYNEWGTEHPLWQSRVRGQFPLQSDDALVSLAWLEAAAAREARYDPALTVQAGIDVAGPGDDETVLCIRQGDAILHLEAWADADARGKVLAALRPWKQRGLDAVNYDSAGIGTYFGPALADEGYPVVPINVGESPTTDKAKEKFLNLRAEVFWNFREWAEAGMLAGLTDRAAIAQLAGIRYEHDNRGKIAIEKKVDARKRGVKSPDRAEAVVLAFWNQPRPRLGQAIADAMSKGTRQPTVQERLAERRARLTAAGARRGWR